MRFLAPLLLAVSLAHAQSEPDPNARQQMDYAPLHGAASRGDMETAKLLLAHGADRAARGSDGMTVAGIARKYGHADFASWIES